MNILVTAYTHTQHTHSGLSLDVVARPVRTIPNKLGSVCSSIICVTILHCPHTFFLCGGVQNYIRDSPVATPWDCPSHTNKRPPVSSFIVLPTCIEFTQRKRKCVYYKTATKKREWSTRAHQPWYVLVLKRIMIPKRCDPQWSLEHKLESCQVITSFLQTAHIKRNPHNGHRNTYWNPVRSSQVSYKRLM